MQTTIVWLRQDLRVSDNPALAEAAARGPVLPLYIWSPEEEGAWPAGGASRWWLHRSLTALASELRRLGAPLAIERGPALAVLENLVRRTGAAAVHWNRRYEPSSVERDTAVKAGLQANGTAVRSFKGSLLFEPWEVSTKGGGPYQVFTRFWQTCRDLEPPARPLPPPPRLTPCAAAPPPCPVEKLGLEPKTAWDAGLRHAWTPGSAAGHCILGDFAAASLEAYDEGRHRLDTAGTSGLSPYLHFGELSPRQVWHATAHKGKGSQTFLSEIGWREFAHHLLFHFPATPAAPLRETFAAFPWEEHGPTLQAWQRGRTGVPLVDAAMRQLWDTGWMPNRARMVVASYLTKNLLQPWQAGAAWFWDTLVDADLANNTLGWQWTAGCGADAAPYFRIFNPVSQAEKFDPDGAYIRHWIPELDRLPAPWIFKPWEAPAGALEAAGIRLGADYPEPLVDLKFSRQRALDAYQRVRKTC